MTGYRELAAHREVRSVVVAQLLSVVGDQLARVALAVLVYDRTGSALASAGAAAATYVPWLVGGPVLAALADRHSRRRVLVLCDLVRAVVVLSLVVPGLPLWSLVALLAFAELAAPVSSAASSAVLPDLLPDEDDYVLGAGLLTTVNELGQVLGFLVGGACVALLGTTGAFAVDAASFLLSAMLFARLRERPVVRSGDDVGLLGDAKAGWAAVARHPRLRLLLPMSWAACAATVVPEGLAAPYADELGGGPVAVGWLLAAVPAGVVVGNLAVGRLVRGSRRDAVVVPLAALGTLALVACAASPSLGATVGLLFVAGLGTAFYVLVGAIVGRETPPELRGRVFGLANTGLMLSQAVALLGAGALSHEIGAAAAMGWCGAVGVAVVASLGLAWRWVSLPVRARHALVPAA